MPEINYVAVLVAAVGSFLLGGLWYSPALFGKAWQREAGLSDEQLKSGNMGRIFGLSLILAFIGVKLVLHYLHGLDDSIPEISIGLSLTVIVLVLLVTTVASLVKVRRDPLARAHAGALRHHERDEAPGGPR